MVVVAKERKISAGSYDLNKWLYGGYDKDIITTIYGGAGSGKTNFCLLVAVSQAAKGKVVIFIDTEGGFSVERVKQIAGEKDYEKALENIILMKPTNFEEQKKAFESLLKEIKSNKNLGLIIVDGMTMLYRLELGEMSQNGKDNETDEDSKREGIRNVNRELARQMRILAEIARKMQIPILVTNQVYTFDDEIRMVGGDILKYWSKCLIELENKGGKRTAYLRKHRSLKESSMPFVVVDSGIKRRGWI